MHDWHNENCDMVFRYELKGVRGFWCKTHNQWAYLRGKVTYTFEPHFSDKYKKAQNENTNQVRDEA